MAPVVHTAACHFFLLPELHSILVELVPKCQCVWASVSVVACTLPSLEVRLLVCRRGWGCKEVPCTSKVLGLPNAVTL